MTLIRTLNGHVIMSKYCWGVGEGFDAKTPCMWMLGHISFSLIFKIKKFLPNLFPYLLSYISISCTIITPSLLPHLTTSLLPLFHFFRTIIQPSDLLCLLLYEPPTHKAYQIFMGYKNLLFIGIWSECKYQYSLYVCDYRE